MDGGHLRLVKAATKHERFTMEGLFEVKRPTLEKGGLAWVEIDN